MEKCNTCRWWHNELCCNVCVDEIKEDCEYFYSYDESLNVSVGDEFSESLINAE